MRSTALIGLMVALVLAVAAPQADADPTITDPNGIEYYPGCLKIGISRTTTRRKNDTIKAWVRIVCRPTNKNMVPEPQPGPFGLLGYFEHALVVAVDGPGNLYWHKRFVVEGTADTPVYAAFYRSDAFPSMAGFWEVTYSYFGTEIPYFPVMRRAKTFAMPRGPNDTTPN